MFDLSAVQSTLAEFNVDAWLLCDFHGSNPLARRILDLETAGMSTRRWFYLVPARGEPVKLVHRIEQGALEALPGTQRVYLRWQELEKEIKAMLAGRGRVAMEYSPRNAIPYIAKVDAGTVELVRSTGAEVVSSGDLIQRFEATLDDAQWQSHLAAETHVLAAYELAVETLADRVRSGAGARETDIQAVIMEYFEAHGLFTDHAPIVAVGPHSGDPHYAPTPETDATIGEGDFVLIDLWARLEKPRAVYADYTKVVFAGTAVPEAHVKIFRIVAAARDAAVQLVRDAFAGGRALHGWQVDDAARHVIESAGYGQYFVHRTGHNIAQDLHGNGTHMDNLETRDERRVLPNTCFSVEPGIYMDTFGVRSEVNVFIDGDGGVHVTGDPQRAVAAIL